jgi:menaquinone-9 beta-reductase
MRPDVAIIGAGLAGASLAARLAEQGRQVVVYERDRFPRDKLCGEFLSPESFRCLETLGCAEEFLAMNPSVMTRARIIAPGGVELELPLPGRAFGLSRRRLDALLLDHARRHGAKVLEGTCVRRFDDVEADVIVGAYGRRTALDRTLERRFFSKRSRLVAFKQHHRIAPSAADNLRGVVELYAFDGGYCGVSYVEEDIVNVCTMFDAGRGLPEGRGFDGVRRWLSRRHGGLAACLETLEPCETETLTVAQIFLGSKEASDGRVLFVGDAAGMIAPLAGDGQAMAIESALRLADLLDAHLPRTPFREWERLWRREFGRRLELGRWLQRALIEPGLAVPAMKVLKRWPQAGAALVELTRGAVTTGVH